MESHNDDCILSDDCIYEILTKVSLPSIPSCISVCKSWRRVAYQPYFGEAHFLRTAATSGFILQTNHYNGYQHTFMSTRSSYAHPIPISFLPPGRPQNVCIEATTPNHNLLFCIIMSENKSKNDIHPHYFITRVGATPSNLPIPNPKTRFDTHGVAIICGTHNIDPTNYEFKIVRISRPRWVPSKAPCLNICEIFDSNARKWRRSYDLPYLSLKDKTGIVINQTAYWMMYDIENPNPRFYLSLIFAFNVEEESRMIITMPDATFITSGKRYDWIMFSYDERLCLAHMSGNNINVWMMMVVACDENTQEWEWKGSYSQQYIKNRKFAFGDGIPNQKVVLLEALQRELWYYLQGRKLVRRLFYPLISIFRISMDGNP